MKFFFKKGQSFDRMRFLMESSFMRLPSVLLRVFLVGVLLWGG